MKENLLTIAAIFIITITFSEIGSAQQYSSQADGFSVWFPIKPTSENRTSSNGIEIKNYSATSGYFSANVAINEIPNVELSADVLSLLYDQTRDSLIAKFKGKLVSDNAISLSGQNGRNLVISANSTVGTLRLANRLFIVGNLLYQISAVTPAKNPQIATVNKFLNSFKFTNLSASSTSIASTVSPEKISEMMTKAVTAYNAKNYVETIRITSEVIKLKPDHEPAYFFRGGSYLDSKQYTLAVADYTKAIALSPSNGAKAESTYNRCQAYNALKNSTAAITDCSNAIALNPQYFLAYFQRGNIYYNSGKTTLALKDYSKVIELKPDYALAYTYRADCYDKLGQKELANQDRETAKSLGQ